MYGLKRQPKKTFQAESSVSRSPITSSTPSRLSILTSNCPSPTPTYGPEGFSSSAAAVRAPLNARNAARDEARILQIPFGLNMTYLPLRLSVLSVTSPEHLPAVR